MTVVLTQEKIIWTLWFQGEDVAPFLVKESIRVWREKNPDFELKVLTNENLHEYMDFSKEDVLWITKLDYAPRSDLIRLYLLSRYGGVWADPTTLCMKPLSQWLDLGDAGFFAFSKPGFDREISSWFMASEKNGYIITRMYESYKNYWRKRAGHKLENHNSFVNTYLSHPRLQWIWFSWLGVLYKRYPYFSIHYMFGVLLRRDSHFRRLWGESKKRAAVGPNMPAKTGMPKLINQEIIDLVNGKEPILKMTWKGFDNDIASDGDTVAGYILGSLSRQ